MTWFTASIAIAYFVPGDPDSKIGVFENVYLIEAPDREKATQKANELGEMVATLDDGLTLNDKPAQRRFLGIRKLRSIYSARPGDTDQLPPISESEVSYSYYEVASMEVAERLGRGERVQVDYVDDADATDGE